ncbi:MAG: hypothetical protein ACYC1Q_08670 [Bacteroidia bacterium]
MVKLLYFLQVLVFFVFWGCNSGNSPEKPVSQSPEIKDTMILSYDMSFGDSIHLELIKHEDRVVITEVKLTSYPILETQYFIDHTRVFRHYDEKKNTSMMIFPKGSERWENISLVGPDFSMISTRNNIGRAHVWRDALIFDVYLSSDTIGQDEKLEIDVLKDSRINSRFFLISRTTGDTVINKALKGTFSHFIVDPREKGNCTYNAVLKRSWKPTDPTDSIVEYHFEDPISFEVFYR